MLKFQRDCPTGSGLIISNPSLLLLAKYSLMFRRFTVPDQGVHIFYFGDIDAIKGSEHEGHLCIADNESDKFDTKGKPYRYAPWRLQESCVSREKRTPINATLLTGRLNPSKYRPESKIRAAEDVGQLKETIHEGQLYCNLTLDETIEDEKPSRGLQFRV